jgi:endoglucanase
MWSPNAFVGLADAAAFNSALYPGDPYVDYVGLDSYNFGDATVRGYTHVWQTGFDLYSAAYDTVTAFTAKPIVVAEVASSENGGSKSDWITTFLGTEIPHDFPAIVGVIWFDQNKEQDWRINSSTASLAAFQAQIAGGEYALATP